MKRILAIAILLFSITQANSQNRPEIDLEQFAENLFQVQSDNIDYEDLYESLLLFYSNPINLNNTSREELSSLYILSPEQINNYMQYQAKNGKLLSIFELQAIPSFDLITIRQLLPFVSVSESELDSRPLLKRILTEPNNYLILRYSSVLEDQQGYSNENNNPYLGDQNKLYGRFRVSHVRDFSIGFTFEKDAGEELNFNNNQYGFDFYSYHFYLQNRGKLKTLAVGDYQLQFGQGLIFGAGFAPGKGAETVASVKRSSLGVRPYSSVLESGFYRGAAATIKQSNIEFTTFYSRLNQDGNISSDTTFTDFDEFISSIQETGFHRTSNELANRDLILEQNVGGNITYKNRNLEIGINGLFTDYSTPIFKTPNNYNQYEFQGDKNYITGISSNYNWQNFIMFGEIARSKSGGIGAIGGFAASLSPMVDLSIVLRNYDRDFHSFYGNSFGESSRNINEKGTYWGIKIKPSKKYFLTAYYDKFSFPWLKFGTEAPSNGHEYLARINYAPKRGMLLYAQLRQEVKEVTEPIENSNLNRLQEVTKNNYIVNLDYKVSKLLTLKSRAQWSNFNQPSGKTSGLALIQDVNVDYQKFRLSTRLALFDTEDFENRQYTYERDVLYSFSIPGYSGRGLRSYILFQYKPTRKLTFQMRYARFKYGDRDEIGSGNEAIEGDVRSDIKIQTRIKF